MIRIRLSGALLVTALIANCVFGAFELPRILADGVNVVPAAEEKSPEPAPANAKTVREQRLRSEFPDVMEQIEEVVAELQMEDTFESLNKLDLVNGYYSSGHMQQSYSYPRVIPLMGDIGANDILLILSNRRVLKLLDELGDLPPGAAAQLVNDRLRTALELYKTLFEEEVLASPWMQELENPASKSSEATGKSARRVGLPLALSDNPDGAPTLRGTRLCVLSLIFLAGTLKLSDALPAINQVVEEAVRQRDIFYHPASYGYRESLGMAALADAGLYSRQVLLVAVSGTADLEHKISDSFEALMKSRNMESPWQSIYVGSFDATLTAFDWPVRLGESPDFDLDRREIRFISYVEDVHFDDLVAELRALLDKSAIPSKTS